MLPLTSRHVAGKLLLKLLFMLALAGAGGGGALFYARHTQGAANADPSAVGEQPASGQAQPAAPPPSAMVELGQFLVNVEGAGGLHYLRSDIAIEIDAADSKKSRGGGGEGEGAGGGDKPKLPLADELRAKDTIVQVLSSARFENLRTADGKEKLKARLLETLQSRLPQQKLRGVLFTSLVMQ